MGWSGQIIINDLQQFLVQFSRFRIADKGFSDDIDYGTRLKNPDTEILSFIRLDFPPTAQ